MNIFKDLERKLETIVDNKGEIENQTIILELERFTLIAI